VIDSGWRRGKFSEDLQRAKDHVGTYGHVRYNMYMTVSITAFRKDIFSLAEAALKGNPVEFVHKGVTFKVIPGQATDKLSNITPLQIINPDCNIEACGAELLAEMEKEWEKDWSQL
jgi:hypothetical protein